MGESRIGAILSAVEDDDEKIDTLVYFGPCSFLFLLGGLILQEKAYVFGPFYGKEEINRGLFLPWYA